MRIILAEPRGFCAGVNMAIEALEAALDAYGSPIYVYHEIVHNKWVVDSFRRKGVVFVNELSEAPEGAMLLYSAHGVPPSVRAEARRRRLKTIDATCPLVTKVHREAARFASEGYTVLLIGHAGHDEVVGTMGEAPASIRLIETAADIDRVEVVDPRRVAYLTQTTLSVDDAAQLIERLRQRFPEAVGPSKDDICYATRSRQEAVRRLAVEADVVLVVGSQNSSNSRRLAELACSCGVASYLIDGPEDIDPSWFSADPQRRQGLGQSCANVERDVAVLITAGASAPESIVEECIRLLQERFGASVETRTVYRERMRFSVPKL